jgi:2-phosphosulfolactate phosphatase
MNKMVATKTVVIDCFPESAEHYRDDFAILVVDVLRATTTATTAISLGWRVFPAQTTDDALMLAEGLEDPLLVGELGGHIPFGFDLPNSPVQVSALSLFRMGRISDPKRPIILVSSSGMNLLTNAKGAPAIYIGCARNFSAVADYVIGRHPRVAILGAGTRGQFRREDQIICAWIAERLINAGYSALTESTSELVGRWHKVDPAEMGRGRSAEFLRQSGQLLDLEFVLHHIDDLDVVPTLIDAELVCVQGTCKTPATLEI